MVIKTWKDFTDEQALLHGKIEKCQVEKWYQTPLILAVSPAHNI